MYAGCFLRLDLSVLSFVYAPVHDGGYFLAGQRTMPERIKISGKNITVFLLIVFCGRLAFALEPDEILVIANADNAESLRIARYYCEKRKVPADNILALPLGAKLSDTIARKDYEKSLAGPIRRELLTKHSPDKIRCLLTTYGVPHKVGKRGLLKDKQERLRELKELEEREKKKIEQLKQNGQTDSPEHRQAAQNLDKLQTEIGFIEGRQTNASVDSELSMVLKGDYELYRWQPNVLKDNVLGLSLNTLMVSRLDGPSCEIAKGLIDKAITAEKTGLEGVVYIDSRGIVREDLFGRFDQSLRDLAVVTRLRTSLSVKEERTSQLFQPGDCPRTAIYCGWYSLKRYVDAFDFVDGAVGYHISSWEAIDIRDPNSTQWCPAMLTDGITATLGAVAEPYLYAFPQPREFFLELYRGSCLVEAFYRTKPFNSWQLVLLGDPLYRPFKKAATD